LKLRDRTERELFGTLTAIEARQLAALVEKVSARAR